MNQNFLEHLNGKKWLIEAYSINILNENGKEKKGKKDTMKKITSSKWYIIPKFGGFSQKVAKDGKLSN